MLEAATGDASARDLLVVVRDSELVHDGERLHGLARSIEDLDTVEHVATEKRDWADAPTVAAPLWMMPRDALEALHTRLSPAGRLEAIRESRRLVKSDPIMGARVVAEDPLGLRWALDPSALDPTGGTFERDSDHVVLKESGAAVLRVTAHAPPMEQRETARLLRGLEDLLDGVPHDLVGGHAIAGEDARRIRRDMIVSSATSMPLVLLFLAFSLGSLFVAHVALAPVFFAIVGGLGVGGAITGPVPAVAVASAAILVGLGVDFAIHVATHVRARLDTGAPPEVAVADSLERAGPAVAAGGATSVAAFLAFAATSIEGLAKFGWLLAVGLVFALATSLTLVPAAMVLRARSGRGVRGERASKLADAVPAAFDRFSDSPFAKAGAALVAFAAIASAALVGLRGIRFDASPGFMRAEDSEVARATARLADELGFAPTGVVTSAPENASAVELFRAGAELQKSKEIGLVTGAAAAPPDPDRSERVEVFRSATRDWVEEALREFEGAGWNAERLRPALERQAATLARDPVIEPGALRSVVHPAAAPDSRAAREDLRRRIEAAMPEGTSIVDPYGMSDAIEPALGRGLARSVLWCGAAVLAIVALVLRGPRTIALALVPATAATAITLGVLSATDWPVHPGNLVALPLVLGLGVDDGLHVVLRSGGRHRRRLGATGRAIWRTSVTTVLGFGSLGFASTPALASLGWLVGVGVTSAYLATVVLMPVLLGVRRGPS